jgi:hypothetical protein
MINQVHISVMCGINANTPSTRSDNKFSCWSTDVSTLNYHVLLN